jgi:hypothetical protein
MQALAGHPRATDLADGQITARRGFNRVKLPCRIFRLAAR